MSKLVEKIKNFFIELSDLINPSELDLGRIHYDKYGRLIFSDDRDLSGWGGFTKDVHCEKFKKGCYNNCRRDYNCVTEIVQSDNDSITKQQMLYPLLPVDIKEKKIAKNPELEDFVRKYIL